METSADRRRRKLIELCAQKGVKNVAARAGLNPDSLDQIIKGVLLPAKKDGTRSPRKLGDEAAQKIEDAEELGRGWFDLPTERTHTSYINIDPAPELRPFRNVPVVGTVQGGEKGFLLELEYATGHGDGFITYPALDQQSYAVRVRGDSMRPRIKAGEFIVVEPNHQCQPGDDVVVVLRDGQRMVKELLYVRDGEATLGSINNGHPNITVAVGDIEKMHYVAAIIPRGAFYKPV